MIFGFCGFGLLRDFVRIPEYVQDINEDQSYINKLTSKMKKYKKVKNYEK